MLQNTVVFQSVSTEHSRWVDACMRSVHDWASIKGADYILIEDEQFLTRLPPWVRDKCTNWIQPLTDLARLEFANDFLDTREFAVWIDSDVLILDQNRLDIPTPEDAAFAREIWVERAVDGSLLLQSKISNYVCAFHKGGSFLHRYREDALNLLWRSDVPLEQGIARTSFVTRNRDKSDFDIIGNLANFSPVVIQALIAEAIDIIAAYDEALQEELYGVNLCLSHEGQEFQGVRTSHDDMVWLVNNLASLSYG